MAVGQSGLRAPGTPWPIAVASVSVGVGFLALWFWLLPPWLGFDATPEGATRWRWSGTLPAVLGFAVALRCAWDFGWTGRGTPAPVAPPQRLVVAGFYRYVRNPMYLGFFVGWAGLWTVLGRANLRALAVALVALLGTHLFVLLYEEPTLRRAFGAEYEAYCKKVRRWAPRMRAWPR